MKKTIVIIGIGELAGVFAKGFLKSGYPVYPITKGMDLLEQSQNIPPPLLVLVTVQENKLAALLAKIPEVWRDKLALVQNELLPRDWRAHQIENPTVTVVWFEKKQKMDVANVLQSPSYGPHAEVISNTLQAVGIPAPILANEDDLLYEMVRKAVYILTVNIAGLKNNCTVGELWNLHQPLAQAIAEEVILIQEFLTATALPKQKIIDGMVEGIKDCPDRYCLGRSAALRLERALKHAKQAGINTPVLLDIAKGVID